MSIPTTPHDRRNYWHYHAEELVLFLGFIAFMVLLGDWWNVYQFSPDEGLNLQKAALVANDYRLYSQIWSDQPPILTYALSFVHQIFPFSVPAARSTILLFAAMLLVCLYRTVRRFEGRTGAVACVSILLITGLFLKLSVSVLIGLPAIALAMLAFDISTGENTRYHRTCLIAGGMVFTLALLTKLFVVLALPALLLAIASSPQKGDEPHLVIRKRVESTLLFATGLVLSLIFLFYAADMNHIEQLVAPHADAKEVNVLAKKGGPLIFLARLYDHSVAALSLGIVGIALVFLHPLKRRLAPLCWFAIAATVLAFHRPLWYHHLLLVLVPLSWLGGIALADLFSRDGTLRNLAVFQHGYVSQHPRAVKTLLCFFGVLIAAVELSRIQTVRSDFNRNPTLTEELRRLRIELFGRISDQVITDRPLDAYYVRKLVPPDLAVWSWKRRLTGNINEAGILATIASFPTAQVSLARFNYSPTFLREVGDQLRITSTHYYGKGKPIGYHFAPKTGLPESSSRPGLADLEPIYLRNRLTNQIIDLQSSLIMPGIGGLWDSEENQQFDRISSDTPLAIGTIVTRPPGSAQELGSCYLATWQQTAERLFLYEALRIAQTLSCAQSAGGGWGKWTPGQDIKCAWKKKARIQTEDTFDDGTSTSVLYFADSLKEALHAAELEVPPWLTKMISRGHDFILESQDIQGGWPQSTKQTGYAALTTLNDDVTTGLLRFLIHAYKQSNNPEYFNAAKQAGNYLLRVQGTGEQPAFAQQYSKDGHPASARLYEPAAYASLETAYAINALIDLYLITEDVRFRQAATDAANWLNDSQVSPGQWARFYEIGTNRALYVSRKGVIHSRLEDLPADEITRYRWRGHRDIFPDIGVALDRVALLERGKQAVSQYDRKFAASALLSPVPTARAWVKPGESEKPSLSNSTRRVVEDCASALSPKIWD